MDPNPRETTPARAAGKIFMFTKSIKIVGYMQASLVLKRTSGFSGAAYSGSANATIPLPAATAMYCLWSNW